MAQKRRNMLAETRLLMEYLAEQYAGCQWWTQFRVGSDPEMVGVTFEDDAERRLARNVNRRVDALVVKPTELVVIEATMFRATEKVGRLQEYLLLLPATPDLQPYLGRPLVGELVTAQSDPVAEVLCRRLGFRYVFREPAWIDEFWAMYPERRRRPVHAGMVAALAEQTEQQP
jgi:hypothetical protein